jgi:hypothetical protein
MGVLFGAQNAAQFIHLRARVVLVNEALVRA